MATMTTMPVSRPLTIEDFEAIRDAAEDRHRYELVDGSLVVTPAPSRVHQRVVSRLLRLLAESNPVPSRHEVLVAPFDVRLGPSTVVQPDVLVVGDDDGAPLLAAEVLSPSTRHLDIGLKWSRYAAGGIAHYWLIDPDVPSVTVWTLVGEHYERAAHGEGASTVHLAVPWPVDVNADSLTRR